MTPESVVRNFFKLGLLRRHGAGIVAALERANEPLADLARLSYAEALFDEGDYCGARQLYAAVVSSHHAVKARQMVDWIDYKHGIVGHGWPAYPGVHAFRGTAGPVALPVIGPVVVANPNVPQELVDRLGLKAWQPGQLPRRPVLVWFNFRASLGGEILAAKIVKAFQKKFALRLILAVDPRLKQVLGDNFSDPVVSKDDDLAPLREICDHYVLARDTLKHVVAEERDFAAVAGEVFTVAASPLLVRGSAASPRVALSWKTTNRKQGLYRNIPLEPLADVLAAHDIEYHSAQHGIAPAERALLERKLGAKIHFDGITPAGTVAELAGQLKAMDAVITIDNSVLHIAGAFDIPTYGLISVPSYWAWPLRGHSARFYRSVTLFHQRQPRKWDDVLAELGACLKTVSDRKTAS